MAFDHGVIASHALALPAISVGNLTVGGTGKTPVAAWMAAQLRDRGTRPALVTRGYGADEPLVHSRLNPNIPVVVDADRVRGVEHARRDGATVVVLDDAFQHRRARRDADVVLVSADRFGGVRMLPAGPWREPLDSLARATVLAVTRRAVSRDRAAHLLAQLLPAAPGVQGVVVYLATDRLVNVSTGIARNSPEIDQTDVIAVSAIGDPRAFESQLVALGARVRSAAFPDHHRFTPPDIRALLQRSSSSSLFICTLKDAVKLGPLWPREAPPLWYLSQRVVLEAGGAALDSVLADVASRATPSSMLTLASAGLTIDSNVP
jgi:tetraacyldisaccharide 4'-kinase